MSSGGRKWMARFGGLILALAMLAGGNVQAQTWLTTTQLASANESCFRMTLNSLLSG